MGIELPGASRRGVAGRRGRMKRVPGFSAADPFGWEAERRRQAAGLPATPPPFGWEAIEPRVEPTRDVDELRRRFEFLLSRNEGRILFALVEEAAAPHLTLSPGLTVEQWAQYLNIRPTQVTAAFRRLHQFGIPKPPAPIPLDGLLRFIADQIKGAAKTWVRGWLQVGYPKGLFDACVNAWLAEYFKTHTGGTQ